MTRNVSNSFNIGLDVTNISKFRNCSNSFVKRILTTNEYDEYLKINTSQRARFLASRWVLKESAFKAISNDHNIFFINIEFSKSDNDSFYYCKTFPNLKTSISYNDDLVYCVAIYVNI